MTAWVTLYCKKIISEDISRPLLDFFEEQDLWTIAEDYNLDTNQVDAAMQQLVIESKDYGYQLNYRDASKRQLTVRVWSKPLVVAEHVGEVEIPSQNGDAIEAHLDHTQCVIGIELGADQIADMAVVLAFEIARWVGQHYAGIIHVDGGDWSYVDDYAFGYF